jgi:CheY-like chemotaxis protein
MEDEVLISKRLISPFAIRRSSAVSIERSGLQRSLWIFPNFSIRCASPQHTLYEESHEIQTGFIPCHATLAVCHICLRPKGLNAMTGPLRLVILNDDMEVAKRLASSISTDGVVVYSTDDPDEACHLISLLQHEIILIDVEKLICTPAYPLEAFREAKPDIKIVGLSRGRRGDTGLLTQLMGLDAYIREPVTPEALIISFPEIADRYLMGLGAESFPDDGENKNSQSWPSGTASFADTRRSPSPQV